MKIVKLNEIAVCNKDNFDFSNVKGVINYLDTSSITDNSVSSFTKYENYKNIPSRAKRAVSNGTIVYSNVRPILRHIGILSNLPQNVVVSTGFTTIDVNEQKIDPYYLYYVLSQDCYTQYLSKIADSAVSAYPSITVSDLSNLKLTIFEDLSYQKKLGQLLKDIDKKIQNNKKQIETLENLAKTIYDYWFVQFDFPNEEGKPYKSSGGKMVWNEELKREIPEYWTVKNLSEVSDIVMGCSPKGDTINTAGDGLLFFQGASDFGNVYPIETAYTTAPIRIAKKGDLMISVRAPVGDINFTLTRCCIGRGLAAISTDKLSKSYLWCFLNNQKAHFSILNRIGTTFGCLSKNDLYKIKIVLPTKNVYNNFISITEPLEKSIRLAHLESTNLTKLKNFLLPLLMNGQVTFKEAKEI